MEKHIPVLKIDSDESYRRFSYLSPLSKRTITTKSTERISFVKEGFSSPKCVRASHEMLMPANKIYSRRNTTLNLSKSILLNNRRIGEKLLLDSFPSEDQTNNP